MSLKRDSFVKIKGEQRKNSLTVYSINLSASYESRIQVLHIFNSPINAENEIGPY